MQTIIIKILKIIQDDSIPLESMKWACGFLATKLQIDLIRQKIKARKLWSHQILKNFGGQGLGF